jgi:hypothetical protein
MTWRDYDYIVMLNSEDIRSSFLLGADDENMDQDELALLVMRGMAALRLTQGFQFVVAPPRIEASTAVGTYNPRQAKSSGKGFPVVAGLALNRQYPVGISEVLKSARDVVCLSMSDQIQQISYDPVGTYSYSPPGMKVERMYATSRRRPRPSLDPTQLPPHRPI